MKKNTLFVSLIITYSLCALALGEWNFYKDNAGEWRWNRTAGNNEIIAASTEGYENREDAVNNATMSGYLIPPDNNLIGDPVEEPSPTPEATPSPSIAEAESTPEATPNDEPLEGPSTTEGVPLPGTTPPPAAVTEPQPCPPCPCSPSPSPQPF